MYVPCLCATCVVYPVCTIFMCVLYVLHVCVVSLCVPCVYVYWMCLVPVEIREDRDSLFCMMIMTFRMWVMGPNSGASASTARALIHGTVSLAHPFWLLLLLFIITFTTYLFIWVNCNIALHEYYIWARANQLLQRKNWSRWFLKLIARKIEWTQRKFWCF